MMHAMPTAAMASGSGWQSVRLPYAGQQLAMTLVLPDEGRLADVEALVGGGRLADLLPTSGGGSVDLTVPRWTFRAAASLAGELADLGMRTAFTADADFSGMTTSEPLQIDEVLQQVFIAVDEAGTEAAAATAVGMGTTAIPVATARLVLDRPFLFVIHDEQHGTPLFLGRVGAP